MQRSACVELGESFPTNIYLQNLVPIQPRTSPIISRFRALGNLNLNFELTNRLFATQLTFLNHLLTKRGQKAPLKSEVHLRARTHLNSHNDAICANTWLHFANVRSQRTNTARDQSCWWSGDFACVCELKLEEDRAEEAARIHPVRQKPNQLCTSQYRYFPGQGRFATRLLSTVRRGPHIPSPQGPVLPAPIENKLSALPLRGLYCEIHKSEI